MEPHPNELMREIAQGAAGLLRQAAEQYADDARQVMIDAAARLGAIGQDLALGRLQPDQAADFARKVPVAMASRLAQLANIGVRSHIVDVITLIVGGFAQILSGFARKA